MGRHNGPEFRDWAALADDNDVLPGLHSVKDRGRVVGKFLQADVAHEHIVSMTDSVWERQRKASQRTRDSVLGTR
jgi:hypothetical protein